MALIRFPEWAPDQPLYQSAGMPTVLNVLAITKNSYSPIQELLTQGSALTARCQGAFSTRGIAGTIKNFAGDATKLYSYDGTTWTDVSRAVGGAYATPSTAQWRFLEYGDFVIALNGSDAPQYFQIGSSTLFANLAGSPPAASFGCVVGPHLLLGRTSGAQNRIYWSGSNDITSWAPGINLSDVQDLPKGGALISMTGGEFCIAETERNIYRLDYVAADPVFTVSCITEDMGCSVSGSVSAFQNNIVFLNYDGFHMISGGAQITPIGHGRVDQLFWSSVNQSFLHRIVSAFDPGNNIYAISFPTMNSLTGDPDQTWFYSLRENRWTPGDFGVDVLYPYIVQAGYNTDTIDAVIGNTDATDYSVDTPLFLGSSYQSLAAFTSAKKLATFSGQNLEALLQTPLVEMVQDRRASLLNIMPIADGGTPQINIESRSRVNDMSISSGYVAQDINGNCPFGIEDRYFQATLKMPAGETWTHIQGIVPDAIPAGLQ